MSASIEEIMSNIRKYAPNFVPKMGIILGSGLSTLAEQIENPITIPYQAAGLMGTSVLGHASLMVLGHLNGVPVVCMRGRLHIYEGATYAEICKLIRVIRHLGAHSVIITGAVGSLRKNIPPGELVLINDHINFQPGNPLVGSNDESIGPRFLSLEDAYDPELNSIMLKSASTLNIPMHQGIYISVLGPSFETPAEIRMFAGLGADVIGMSVVPDVIIARHCGLRVTALTAVTNYGVGLSPERVTHEGTLHHAEQASYKVIKIITKFVADAALVLM